MIKVNFNNGGKLAWPLGSLHLAFLMPVCGFTFVGIDLLMKISPQKPFLSVVLETH